jgi:hypothetical protein
MWKRGLSRSDLHPGVLLRYFARGQFYFYLVLRKVGVNSHLVLVWTFHRKISLNIYIDDLIGRAEYLSRE